MELSQLHAGNGASASQPLAKSDGKTNGNSEAEFARLFKQAGELNKNATTASKTAAETLGDESAVQDETIITLPADLAPLTQQITQAIESNLTGGAHAPPAEQQHVALDAMATEGGLSLAAPFSPLSPASVDAGEALTDIRQRMDIIASAQRGDTLPADQSAKLAVSAAHLITDASGKPSNNDRAMTLADVPMAGQRHQQLAAQGMQALSQQQAQLQQPATQAAGTFTDAIAAVSASDSVLPARHGAEGSFSQSLMGATAPTGNPASTSNAGMPAAGQLTPTLTAPLASPQWQQGLGQQVLALHQRGGQQVELHLRPAELGPLSISLKVDDQLAQAQFFSANPQVRAAIEQAIPQLREALEESGIQLGEAMVGEHQQRDDNRDQGPAGRRMAGAASDATTTAPDDTLVTQATTGIGTDGNAIDLYA